jgi:hypothetical protein
MSTKQIGEIVVSRSIDAAGGLKLEFGVPRRPAVAFPAALMPRLDWNVSTGTICSCVAFFSQHCVRKARPIGTRRSLRWPPLWRKVLPVKGAGSRCAVDAAVGIVVPGGREEMQTAAIKDLAGSPQLASHDAVGDCYVQPRKAGRVYRQE